MIIVIGIATLFGETGIFILFGLISLQALREFFSSSYTRRGDYLALFSSFFVILPFQYYLVKINKIQLFSIFIPVFVFTLLPVFSVLKNDTERFLERIASIQWGVMISVYCLSFIPALLGLTIANYAGKNILLIAFLLMVVQLSDVFQFIWGKLIGKHKIAPIISPSKTYEGLIGGIICSTLLGASLFKITPFSMIQAAIMALIINLFGVLGGLVLSAIKRDKKIKDWGNLIKGHGGILDRVDSLVFSAPMFFYIIKLYF